MDYESIGHNIRKRRETNGLTREKLAEMVDLSTSYVSALERGEKLPKLETFIRIANALDISADLLLNRVLSNQNQIVASELAKQIEHLSISEQRRILNVVNTMVSDANKL